MSPGHVRSFVTARLKHRLTKITLQGRRQIQMFHLHVRLLVASSPEVEITVVALVWS